MARRAAPAASTAANAAKESDNDGPRSRLMISKAALSPWLESDDYKTLPGQLKLGVTHLMTEVINTADSPHTSDHAMEDALALTSYGLQYLSSQPENECTPARIEAFRSAQETERKKLDVQAANLVLTWRCQRFPTHGIPSLILNTNDFLIPEVQALRIAGGSGPRAVAEVNEDALRAEVQRYSRELKLRVISRQQELARDLQQKQKEQQELKERKRLGLRGRWGHKMPS